MAWGGLALHVPIWGQPRMLQFCDSSPQDLCHSHYCRCLALAALQVDQYGFSGGVYLQVGRWPHSQHPAGPRARPGALGLPATPG